MRYAIVIEKGPTSFGAYIPDLPTGINTTGEVEIAPALIVRRFGPPFD